MQYAPLTAVVDAVRFTGAQNSIQEVKDFIARAGGEKGVLIWDKRAEDGGWIALTNQTIHFNKNDFIIRDSLGKYAVMDAARFCAKYAPVSK